MRKFLQLCLILLIANIAVAQTGNIANTTAYQLSIVKTTHPVKVDGDTTDIAWQNAQIATSFWVKYPVDGIKAKRLTEVRTSFDKEYLYLLFICHDSGTVVSQSLKRDYGHDGQDGVAVMIDPYSTKTNGFFFVVNPYNAQSEAQLKINGKPDFSWDNKWYSATRRLKDKWIAEMAIPFKTLRYNTGLLKWSINFLRVDLKSNEYSVWAPVPVNFESYDLGFLGTLNWSEAPPPSGKNASIIPYITGGLQEQRALQQGVSTTANAGADAKIALSSSLNLDLTVNPDFSQIEVDDQVTNLTRFNIFFPEKRTFFLENADLFSEYGIPPIRPFYSRTIGLDANGQTVPILLGARLSGNLGNRTRIGIMSMQTGKKNNHPSENYTAVSVSEQVLKRSTIKAYFLNRQAFLTKAQKDADPLLEYGRNAGVELAYNSNNGSLQSWMSWHGSDKPGIKGNNAYYSLGAFYTQRNFNSVLDVGTIGTNYYTDMGFLERIENYDALRDTVIRMGYHQVFNENNFKIFPDKGPINRHEFGWENFYVSNPDYTFNEFSSELSYSMAFRSAARISTGVEYSRINLMYPTSFTGGNPLPIGLYNFAEASVEYSSDYRKPFKFSSGISHGAFYNGQKSGISASVTFRKQPYLSVSVRGDYFNISFPANYGSAKLFLIAPKVEVNFSTRLFWTTFLQYNSQRNNFNINSRLQWRYRPMSDFFLVYTDNYFTDPLFKSKSRALVFKANYWLNL